MRKYEFLYRLENALESFSVDERDEIIHYYEELIQDAVDNGEKAAEFIEKLGSVEKIVRTIKKDSDFVENVKEKKDYELNQVVSKSIRTIGTILFIFLLVIGYSISVSVIVSGIASIVTSIISIVHFTNIGSQTLTIIFFSGYILIHIGLILLGITATWYLSKKAKGNFELLLEKLDKLINKEAKAQ